VAATEVDDAVTYYEDRAIGLGREFALEVQRGLRRIEDFPNAWRKLGRRGRWHRLNRFPYGIVYAVFPDEIVVVAVMHMKQKPGTWQARLAVAPPKTTDT
jgi:ParE toxin of type II toxin-antitoxin system, parDE